MGHSAIMTLWAIIALPTTVAAWCRCQTLGAKTHRIQQRQTEPLPYTFTVQPGCVLTIYSTVTHY